MAAFGRFSPYAEVDFIKVSIQRQRPASRDPKATLERFTNALISRSLKAVK